MEMGQGTGEGVRLMGVSVGVWETVEVQVRVI